GRVVRVAHLDAAGGRRRRFRETRPPEAQVLERESERLGVRELPLEQVEGGLEGGELVVLELELGEEVLLRPERVELFARELVPLRMERNAERVQLRAVGVEPARERLVRHLRVALDVHLDVPRGE